MHGVCSVGSVLRAGLGGQLDGVVVAARAGCGPAALKDLLRCGPQAAKAVPDAAATVVDVTRWLQAVSQYLVQHPE